MKIVFIVLSVLILLVSCDNTTKIKDEANDVSILPQPKHLQVAQKKVVLSTDSKFYSPHAEVYPLLELLSSEIELVTGIGLATTTSKNNEADIVFKMDTSLMRSEYHIDINEIVMVSGGSYTALVYAKNTLLHMVKMSENSVVFPIVEIRDSPDAAYRGLMIDLARKWHDVGTIKKIINLAAYYKIGFLQLHFTDNQSYTLPSKKYPKLSTAEKHYSYAELEELEAYSQLRGVTIIPEIDVPGHSKQFTKKYGEIFAIESDENNPSIVNMGKEEVYEALDVLIGETLSVFKSTPYFHIGGDEAKFNGLMDDPDVRKYMVKNKLDIDVHELFNHFINRMNSIVKKYNKQMCVWEGFGPDANIEISKDIIVFPFETNRYLPTELINDGYTLVNVSWKPLYVVNEKKWEPKTIYDWNMWRWENWWDKAPSFEPIQASKSDLVIGAQMCAWEQAQEDEIPSLRKRLPAFVERIWNTEEKISYDELMKRMLFLDKRLSILINDDRQDTLLIGHNYEKIK
ncbi:family 20 glycosylhydrolase [Labilibacter marinus]|uniref:family 20 glycosylhydrolase n=1 Tax=Labilibacter marinus TaxID=1477105 RepID=UPI00094F497A|nr:family 20 glycosylhydrolase [Labilibacter marinus]